MPAPTGQKKAKEGVIPITLPWLFLIAVSCIKLLEPHI
jgi:hypothetical protein